MTAMTNAQDLIERLNDWPRMTPAACKEAAAEIERLWAENETLQAEVERLQALLRHGDDWRNENKQVWAEVERLTVALRAIVDVGSATSVQIAIAALEYKP